MSTSGTDKKFPIYNLWLDPHIPSPEEPPPPIKKEEVTIGTNLTLQTI
jgi:hypothetical protein